MRNPLRIYLERRCINIAELARRADIPNEDDHLFR